MSQSLTNLVVHLVFSTKGRRPLIRDQERDQLHAYITGVLKNHDSPLIEINSIRDHTEQRVPFSCANSTAAWK